MKKILLALITLLSFAGISSAQSLASFSEGFYRVQNVHYLRYMSLLDNKGSVSQTMGSVNADLYAIRTLLDNDVNNISSNPATVVHISSISDGYSCSAQGIDTKTLTSYPFRITTSPSTSGAYRLSAEANGGRVVLNEVTRYTSSFDELPDSGYLGTSVQTGDPTNIRDWYITPIESNTSCYFGFSPSLQSNGKYYQTFYAEFPFRIVSSGVKVYYISNLYWAGQAVYREFNTGDVVPGATPVIVECSSSNASDNQVQPVLEDGLAPESNYLQGVYFNYYFADGGRARIHDNRTAFNPSNMRVLRVQSDGTLAFVNNPSEAQNGTYYLPANEAYLSVPEGSPAVMPLMAYSDYLTGIKSVKVDDSSASAKDPVYTIDGVKVKSTENLPHGIYIQGGKKVVR